MSEWIPVSKRMPELHEASPLLKKFVNKVSDEVLVTIEDKKNGTRTVSSQCYLWDNLWHGDIFDWLKASKCDFEIIAWMPLPQPYKAKSEG